MLKGSNSNNVNKNFNEYQKAIGEKFENIKIEENSIQALASKNTDILSDGENIIDVKEL